MTKDPSKVNKVYSMSYQTWSVERELESGENAIVVIVEGEKWVPFDGLKKDMGLLVDWRGLNWALGLGLYLGGHPCNF